MNEFLKKNETFIAIIIAAFIIGGFVYLSNPNRETESQKQSLRCKELAIPAYEFFKKQHPEAEKFWFNFAYNKKLKTCLYSGEYIRWKGIDDDYDERVNFIFVSSVRDVYTDKKLISYSGPVLETDPFRVCGNEFFKEFKEECLQYMEYIAEKSELLMME